MKGVVLLFLTCFFLGISCAEREVEIVQAEDSKPPNIKKISVRKEKSKFPRGKKVFEEQCSVCHKLFEVSVGPPLAGVAKRRKREWLRRFIYNSQKLIFEGDPEAREIYEKYDQRVMTSFFLSNREFDQLLKYLDEADEKKEAEKD